MSEDESQNDDPMEIDVSFYYEIGQEPVLRSQEVALRDSANERMRTFEEEYQQKRQESNKKMQETLAKILGPCQAHVFANDDDDQIPISLKVDLLEAARICDRTLKHAAYYAESNNKDPRHWKTLCATYLDAYLTEKLLESVSINETLRELFCPRNPFQNICVHIDKIKTKYGQDLPPTQTVEDDANKDWYAITALFGPENAPLRDVSHLLLEKKYINQAMEKFGNKLASAYEKATKTRAQALGSTDFTPRLRF